MLAFLHTARVHVETFGRIAREVDSAIPVRHEVQEGLLTSVLAAGTITDDIRASIAAAVQALASDGARVIVPTCSTIGGMAETVAVSDGVVVMRIDRPMAEQAVASGRRIVVLAALASTFQPTVALLRQVASDAKRSLDFVEVLCEHAWRFFEIGDHSGYALEIAKTIERSARPGDLVLLAQASMAPAVELVPDLGIPVLSSPKLGVQAAMSKYRATVKQ
jgi:hypothetical protein